MDAKISTLVESFARPLTGAGEDHDPLLEMIGDARFVLLGEASHRTSDFYSARANYQTVDRREELQGGYFASKKT